MTSLCVLVTMLVAHALQVACQFPPVSPCPSTFRFEGGGENLEGFITVKNISYDDQFINLHSTFTYDGLLEDTQELVQVEMEKTGKNEILNTVDGYKVLVHVFLPKTALVPRVSVIQVNGAVLCEELETNNNKTKTHVHIDLITEIRDGGILFHRPGTVLPTRRVVQCGTVDGGDYKPLVYLGSDVSETDWPWLVAMFRNVSGELKFICSGSLVTNRHVISAAHCVYQSRRNKDIQNLVIKLGVYNVSDHTDEEVQTRNVISADAHEDYSFRNLRNDMMLLTLNRRVNFTERIRPVCLWSGSNEQSNVVGRKGAVIGWGSSQPREAGKGPPNLVELAIVSTSTCRGHHIVFHKLTSNKTLCAGNLDGSGPCNGDSGAGLYIREENYWKLRGIVSASLPNPNDNTCNREEYFIFTDTAQFLPWIKGRLE